MRANCSERAGRQRGFTTIEVIAVIVLVGALAAAVLPRLDGAVGQRGDHWRDQVLAALRHAQATATSHRRLVCASVATGAVTLTIAAANPATACTLALPGPDGHASHARDGRGIATTPAPAGSFFFQPDGRVTTDGAGSSASDRTIAVAGQPDIVVVGSTGHVR